MFYRTYHHSFTVIIIKYGSDFITSQFCKCERMRLISDPTVIIERNEKRTIIFTLVQDFRHSVHIDRRHIIRSHFRRTFQSKICQHIILCRIYIKRLNQYRQIIPSISHLIMIPFSKMIIDFFCRNMMLCIITSRNNTVGQFISCIYIIINKLRAFADINTISVSIVLQRPFTDI